MNKILAKIIMEQCIGSYSGHMASIPNNPIIYSMFRAVMTEHNTRNDEKDFAIALRKIADALEDKK